MKKFIILALSMVAIISCLVACEKDPQDDPAATTTAAPDATTTKVTVTTEITEPVDEEGWSKFY